MSIHLHVSLSLLVTWFLSNDRKCPVRTIILWQGERKGSITNGKAVILVVSNVLCFTYTIIQPTVKGWWWLHFYNSLRPSILWLWQFDPWSSLDLTMFCACKHCSWSLHWKESLVKLEMSWPMRYLWFQVLAVVVSCHIFWHCFVGGAEHVHESIKATTCLVSRTYILDCFSVSHIGFWAWPLFSEWILYGVLVYACGVYKADREDAVTSPC